MKLCVRCLKELPLEWFENYKNKQTGNILKRNMCKECQEKTK